jgi:hypothetical protein
VNLVENDVFSRCCIAATFITAMTFLVAAAISPTSAALDTVLPVIEGRVASDKPFSYSGKSFYFYYVKVDVRKLTIGVTIPADGLGGASLERLFQDNYPLALVNAGFVESFAPVIPAGLVIYRGKKLSEEKVGDPLLSAIVCFKSKQAGV